MNKEILKYIGDYLSDNSKITIPKFGTISAQYASAQIDHVQGLLIPPTYRYTFDAKHDEEDEVLLNLILKNNRISTQTAQQHIKDFALSTSIALSKKEMVLIEGVGSLYKDYEGNFNVLKDQDNLNPESFGLPKVKFYPVLRNKEHAIELATTKDVRKPSASVRSSSYKEVVQSVQTVLPLIAGFSIIAFAAIYLISTNQRAARDIAHAVPMPVSEKRLNKKPKLQEQTTLSLIDGFHSTTVEKDAESTIDLEEAALVENLLEEEEKTAQNLQSDNNSLATTEDELPEEETPDYESIVIGPSRHQGVIIIGAYKYRRSVQKMADRILAEGFDVYQDKMSNGEITRVGAQFMYEDEDELQQKLEIIQNKIEAKAWLFKK